MEISVVLLFYKYIHCVPTRETFWKTMAISTRLNIYFIYDKIREMYIL